MFPMCVIVRVVSIQLGNVENELESSMNQCEVLRHTLSDRQAQIDLQSTHDNVSTSLGPLQSKKIQDNYGSGWVQVSL